ncbi:flagellar hook-basal body complex protein FliE [Proteiniborus sp.]|uniref:flagellar hook-basal body complex protein FliE n=1 Tax=Proteiniborus sp. TaxID=2079015 RepID=UPI00332F90ED
MKIEKLSNTFTENNKKILGKQLENKTAFNDFLKNALDEVNQLQTESESYTKLLALGQVENIHDVTIASEKAKIALQMTLAIRNKVVDAYKEIMRMQV